MNKELKATIRKFLPRSIKNHRILRGDLAGRRIYTSWHDYPGAISGRTEKPLLAYFAKEAKTGETWLDIGAHYGYTAIALSGIVGNKGRVYAFEPMLSTVGYLYRTREANGFPQMNVVPFALSNDPDGLHVLRLPSTRGMIEGGHLRRGGDDTEVLYVTNLDWLWPQICEGNTKVHGVKIDVQGMEIHTIRGMAKLLAEHRPKLIVELHNGVDREEFLTLIEGLGYSRNAIAIEPVEGETTAQLLDNKSYAFPLA